MGTGTGVVAQVAQELGATAVGVDPSEGMLDVARSTRPGIEFLAAQAIDLPFVDGRFDVVLGNFVLAHFANVETALFDIMRVTRPGGVIGFTTWTDGRDAFTDAWLELVSTVVPDDLLAPTLDKAIRTTTGSHGVPPSRRSCSTRGSGTCGRSRGSTSGVTAATSSSTASPYGRRGDSSARCSVRRRGRRSWNACARRSPIASRSTARPP